MISQNVNGNTSYFGYDGLGSTKFLTNQNGQITDSYQYNAYGELINQTGNTDNIYLYTGEQYDRSLNQYYLRARYYNQGVGRFTQMDSWQGKASNPITLNKYLYADANPVMNIDPSGRMSLGGMMSAINTMATLSTVATTSYDVGTALYGHYTGESLISFDKATVKQIAFAAAFSYGATKAIKGILRHPKYKKLLKEHTLYRGVNNKHFGYEDARTGYVGGKYTDLLNPSTYDWDTAIEHNTGNSAFTQFTSWTKKWKVAKHFATREGYGRSHGIVIKANIMAFRIFKSPNLKDVHIGGGVIMNEGEYLVVGPVQGIPIPVK